ncbi:MAG: precorrin-6A synthase (deacetylating) [Reyranella sp.]
MPIRSIVRSFGASRNMASGRADVRESAMKTILIIGIGAGDPDYITVQAVKALNRVDVFFLMDKGPAKQKLRALREDLCRRHIEDRAYRFVEDRSPPRDSAPADYRASVDALNREKQAVLERMIETDMKDGETAGILVWGDPMLYDSTIRNIEAIAAGGRHQVEYDVIPGITAVQALAARHKIPLNRIAEPVVLTTGRKLAEGFPSGTDSVVVLLDGEDTYRRFADADVHGDMEIYWGAYLGTPDEILVAGKVADVADEIHRRRAEARRANGWIMDTYLMRKANKKAG